MKLLHKIETLQRAALYFGIGGIFLLMAAGIFFFTGLSVEAKEKTVTPPDFFGEALIHIQGMGKENEEGELVYYDEGVQGTLSVQEKYLERERVEIYAIPRDHVANEQFIPQGQGDMVDKRSWERIWLWTSTGTGEEKEVNIPWRKQGKWQLLFQSDGFHAVSVPFVVDREAPELEVSYARKKGISSAVSSPDNLQNKINRNLSRISSSACEVYSGKGGVVNLQIREDYVEPEKIKVTIVETKYEDGSHTAIRQEHGKEQNWSKEGDTAALSLEFAQEGHFKIKVEYEDRLGHKLTAQKGSETAVCMQEGRYEGPTYTVDQTPPVLRAFTFVEKGETEKNYFAEPPEIILEIEEENFNRQDFSFENEATWADGSLVCPRLSAEDYPLLWTCRYEEEKRINRAVLKMDLEANYAFSGKAADGAGWSGEEQNGYCIYDRSEPEVQIILSGLQKQPYASYPYCSHKGIDLCIKVTDRISGVKGIRYYYVDRQQRGEEQEMERPAEEQTHAPMQWLFHLTREKEIKGKIVVQAEDAMGKKSLWKEGEGMIMETKEGHTKTSQMTLSLSAPDYIDEKKKIKYYRHKVVIDLQAEDRCSGLRSLSLSAETGEKKQQKKKEQYDTKKELTEADAIQMEIKAEDFSETSKKNPVEIKGRMLDNAGHQTVRKYDEYKLVIDGHKPQIMVRYNTNRASHGKYYRQTRVATITIKDWNFNPKAVEWMIAGSNQGYQIGEWTGTGEVHQCQVRFSEDGEEYKIKLAATDYAGNRSCWDEDSSFVIDKTPPQVNMVMEQKTMRNGKYYKTPPRVFVQVLEKHLDKAALKYKRKMQGKNQSKNKIQEHIVRKGKRKKNTDWYFFTARFDRDGQYHLIFHCQDKAGNRSPALRICPFILDQTAPEIRVSGLEKGMSYQGEIAPEILLKDMHLNTEKIQAVIERTDGSKIKRFPAKERRTGNAQERKYVWEDFSYKKKTDGIYRLKAVAEDLAGNRSCLGTGIPFTINRFGASFQVFQIENGKRKALNKQYRRKAEDIVITEASVIPTDMQIRLLKDNRSREEIIPISTRRQVEGKKGWSVWEHRIEQRHFQEEGTYQITAYSTGYVFRQGRKDRIKESSNDLQGKEICFTIDKTPPVVEISGLEEKRYVEKEHSFMIRVMDNYEVSHLKVYIRQDGKKSDNVIAIQGEELGEEHSITKTLRAASGEQEVWVRAWDKAGNCTDSRERKAGRKRGICCVVTEDIQKEKGTKPERFAEQIREKVGGEIMGMFFLSLTVLLAFMLVDRRF